MGTFLLVACLVFPASYWFSESLCSGLPAFRTTHTDSNRWAYKRCLGTIGGTSAGCKSLERKFVFTVFLSLLLSLPLSLSNPLSPTQSSAHRFSTHILWQKRKKRCWQGPRAECIACLESKLPRMRVNLQVYRAGASRELPLVQHLRPIICWMRCLSIYGKGSHILVVMHDLNNV